MKKIMMKVIRVFLGISLVLIVLHYVYNLTSLPKEEILIPSLTTEALKKNRYNQARRNVSFRRISCNICFF